MKACIDKLICGLAIILGISCFGYPNASAEEFINVKKLIDELPILSGPVTVLPWDNDNVFLKAMENSGTDRLIAAYKTVLLDPLPGEEFNVHLCAKLMSGTVVEPGCVFSQNKTAGPYTIKKGFQKGPTYTGPKLITTTGGGICKVATTLYNVTVLSNLPVIERHYHSMPVSYVPYGQDATVAYGSLDFKFKNNTNSPILIWAHGIGDTLNIAFYGNYTPPKVEWQHETLSTTKTATVYKTIKNLAPETKKVVVHGMDGKVVKSTVIITFSDGKVVKKNMGISKDKPLLYIIEVG